MLCWGEVGRGRLQALGKGHGFLEMLFELVSLSTLLEIPGTGGCFTQAWGWGSLAEAGILIPGLETAGERPGVVVTTLFAHHRWGRGTLSM